MKYIFLFKKLRDIKILLRVIFIIIIVAVASYFGLRGFLKWIYSLIDLF